MCVAKAFEHDTEKWVLEHTKHNTEQNGMRPKSGPTVQKVKLSAHDLPPHWLEEN
jgi:hypothetical protein